LKLASGSIVLAADCCYLKQTLDASHLPRFVYNREQMLESLDHLRALQSGGARIFFGHDPQFWKSVPQAPEPIR
jgi:glyoxylase-like metal-dependent hydrolase (beta-lactamase superfamily II)